MFGNKLSSIPMLISLVRAYIKKEYREIPIGIIISVVITFVWQLIEDDVAEYKQWQKANGKRILEDE